MPRTIDPLLSTSTETVIWDLEDDAPMPPEGACYSVIREDYDMADDGSVLRTIRRVTLHADPAR